MTRQQIQSKVKSALGKFIEDEKFLLEKNVNERTITHKLALYLEKEFSEWDVDCEYNRNRDDTKHLDVTKELNLPVQAIQSNDDDGVTVYPDIIVHKRGTDSNLLVIEVKKTTSQRSADYDLWKLCEYKRQLGYTHALFLKLCSGSNFRSKASEFKWIDQNVCGMIKQKLPKIFPNLKLEASNEII